MVETVSSIAKDSPALGNGAARARYTGSGFAQAISSRFPSISRILSRDSVSGVIHQEFIQVRLQAQVQHTRPQASRKHDRRSAQYFEERWTYSLEHQTSTTDSETKRGQRGQPAILTTRRKAVKDRRLAQSAKDPAVRRELGSVPGARVNGWTGRRDRVVQRLSARLGKTKARPSATQQRAKDTQKDAPEEIAAAPGARREEQGSAQGAWRRGKKSKGKRKQRARRIWDRWRAWEARGRVEKLGRRPAGLDLSVFERAREREFARWVDWQGGEGPAHQPKRPPQRSDRVSPRRPQDCALSARRLRYCTYQTECLVYRPCSKVPRYLCTQVRYGREEPGQFLIGFKSTSLHRTSLQPPRGSSVVCQIRKVRGIV